MYWNAKIILNLEFDLLVIVCGQLAQVLDTPVWWTTYVTLGHGLSQQGVWVPFWTPQDTQIFLCGILILIF